MKKMILCLSLFLVACSIDSPIEQASELVAESIAQEIDPADLSLSEVRFRVLDKWLWLNFKITYKGDAPIYYLYGSQIEYREETLLVGVLDFSTYLDFLETMLQVYPRVPVTRYFLDKISISREDGFISKKDMIFTIPISFLPIDIDTFLSIDRITFGFYYYPENIPRRMREDFMEELPNRLGTYIELSAENFQIVDVRKEMEILA